MTFPRRVASSDSSCIFETMFGAFRINPTTKDLEYVELEKADGFEARGYSRTACNECRARKLKCSGEKSGCRRCRAVATTCIYHPNANMSADRSERQVTHSSASSTSVPSSANNSEMEQTTRPRSRQEIGYQTQSSGTSGTVVGVTGGPRVQGPPTPLVPATDLSWALSLPEASNMDWDFDTGDFRHITEVDEDSSVVDSSLSLDPQDPPIVSPSIADSRNHGRSESWDSVVDTFSLMEPPRRHSWFMPGPSNAHRPESDNYSADIFALPTPTSGSSTSGNISPPKLTSARTGGRSKSSDALRSCRCITIMLNMLENNGAQGPSKDPHDAGVGLDDIFSSLARGINSIDQVLRCGQCDACTENGMLLATIAKQLCTTAVSVTAYFPAQEHPYDNDSTKWCEDHNLNIRDTQRPPISDAGAMALSKSFLDSSVSKSRTRSTSDLLEGAICFGHYKVHNPEIRDQIVQHALLLHIRQLREILGRAKDKMATNRGAWKVLSDEEDRVEKLWAIFHSKVSNQ